jgi:hypothetical protein
MSQKQQLNEFQQTLKELQKMGTFSEQEIQYMSDMEKSMEQITQELNQDKLVVGIYNASRNNTPAILGNQLSIRTNQASSAWIAKNSFGILATGIVLQLPSNVTFTTSTPKTQFQRGVAVVGHYFENGELFVCLVNHNAASVEFIHGTEIATLTFAYALDESTITLKPIAS